MSAGDRASTLVRVTARVRGAGGWSGCYVQVGRRGWAEGGQEAPGGGGGAPHLDARVLPGYSPPVEGGSDVWASGHGQDDVGQSRGHRVRHHLLQRLLRHARLQVPRRVGAHGAHPASRASAAASDFCPRLRPRSSPLGQGRPRFVYAHSSPRLPGNSHFESQTQNSTPEGMVPVLIRSCRSIGALSCTTCFRKFAKSKCRRTADVFPRCGCVHFCLCVAQHSLTRPLQPRAYKAVVHRQHVRTHKGNKNLHILFEL